MSFGGTSSSQQSWFPGSEDYLNKFKGIGSNYISQIDPTGGQFRKVGEQQLLDTASGKYLNPESNPYLAKTADVISRTSQENVNKTLNRLGGQAQMGGAWGSNKAAQVNATTGRAMMQDLADKQAGLYGTNYERERALQTQAIQPLIKQGEYPEQLALQIAQMFGGIGTNTSNSSPSLLGWLL